MNKRIQLAGVFIIWLLFSAWLSCANGAQFPGMVRVPRTSELTEFPRELRYELELVAGMTLEDALKYSILTPGSFVDFDSPTIRFVREWNAWIKIRLRNVNLRNSRDFLDAAEIIQKNRARDAWAQLGKNQEEEFKQWKRVKKAGEKMLRGLR